jgi:hypothetical protein
VIEFVIVNEIVTPGRGTIPLGPTSITISITSSIHDPMRTPTVGPYPPRAVGSPCREDVRVRERVAGSRRLVPPPMRHAFAHAHEFAHATVHLPGS